MPDLDFSDVISDPTFASLIKVIRRAETVGANGRATNTEETFEGVVAIVIGEGGDYITNPDERHMPSIVHIHTMFRLRGPATGYRADLVVIGGDTYQVGVLNDYSGFGGGFVSADCASIETMDAPP